MDKYFLAEFVYEDEGPYEIVDAHDGTVLFAGSPEDVPTEMFHLELVGCFYRLDQDHYTFVARVISEG